MPCVCLFYIANIFGNTTINNWRQWEMALIYSRNSNNQETCMQGRCLILFLLWRRFFPGVFTSKNIKSRMKESLELKPIHFFHQHRDSRVAHVRSSVSWSEWKPITDALYCGVTSWAHAQKRHFEKPPRFNTRLQAGEGIMLWLCL